MSASGRHGTDRKMTPFRYSWDQDVQFDGVWMEVPTLGPRSPI